MRVLDRITFYQTENIAYNTTNFIRLSQTELSKFYE